MPKIFFTIFYSQWMSKSTGEGACKLLNNFNVMEGASRHLEKTLAIIEYELALSSMAAKDYEEGIKLYKLAASHGSASAMYNLGIHLQLGIGIEKNVKFAYECFTKAAAMGHEKAMHNKLEYEKGFKNKRIVGRFSQRSE